MTHYKRPYANNTICGEDATDEDAGVSPFVEHVDCPECLKALVAQHQADSDRIRALEQENEELGQRPDVQVIQRVEIVNEPPPREEAPQKHGRVPIGCGGVVGLVAFVLWSSWCLNLLDPPPPPPTPARSEATAFRTEGPDPCLWVNTRLTKALGMWTMTRTDEPGMKGVPLMKGTGPTITLIVSALERYEDATGLRRTTVAGLLQWTGECP